MATVATKEFGIESPFWLEIARGNIPYHKTAIRVGYMPDLDSTEGSQSVRDFPGLTIFPSSASILTISSSSTEDSSIGTGARTVLLTGLDANYREISETLILNGQTPVSTINQYLRYYTIVVLTAGSAENTVGTIYLGVGTVTAGVPATVYLQIQPNINVSRSCHWTVPAGYTAYITYILTSTNTTAANRFTEFTLAIRPFGGVFNRASGIVLVDSPLEVVPQIPGRVNEKSDIDFLALSSDDNIRINLRVVLVYIKNSADGYFV